MSWMPDGLVDVALAEAASDAPLLIVGESGVGKDTLARKIHDLSARAKGPFVGINCAGLVDDLLLGVIFGDGDQEGTLAKAGGGTFLMSEFGETSLEVQRKLLLEVERGAFSAVRLIVDTNRDLK